MCSATGDVRFGPKADIYGLRCILVIAPPAFNDFAG
jgi:hypothetical protein